MKHAEVAEMRIIEIITKLQNSKCDGLIRTLSDHRGPLRSLRDLLHEEFHAEFAEVFAERAEL